MLLLVDAGNTSIKWALAGAGDARLGKWLGSGSCARQDAAQLAVAWREAVAGTVANAAVTRLLISNVAGGELRALLAAQALDAFGAAAPLHWFSSRPALAGVRNGYGDPAQLGCDRFAAAIGAHALFPERPLIVVHCGTATTVDALTADGHFLGGMILPGLGLMARSLASNTAQLPQAPPQPVALDRFADNTMDAIASGCIAAQAGAIERALALHRKTQAAGAVQAPVQCVLAGGAAAYIAPHLTVPCERVDNLVLIGLQAVALDDGMTC